MADMARPRPLARLIDGPSEMNGAQVVQRVTWLLVPAMVVSNAVGALVVFVLAGFVVPTPDDLEDKIEILIENAAALTIYLGIALIIGVRWGVRRSRAATQWLQEDRTPDAREQRRTLR